MHGTTLSNVQRAAMRVAAVLLGALIGCGAPAPGTQDGAGPEPSDRERPGPLCPSCQVLAGGETTDFGGGPAPERCTVERSALERDDASLLGFAPADVLSFVEGSHTLSAQWRAGEDGELGDPTEVELEVTVEAIDALRASPRAGFTAGDCPDALVIDAHIALEAADGSLAGTLPATLISVRDDLVEAHGLGAIADFTGRAPAIDRERKHRGAVLAALWFEPEAVQGSAGPLIEFEDPKSERGWSVDAREPELLWPIDPCDADHDVLYRPVQAGESATGAYGQAWDALVDELRARAREHSFVARWTSGGETALSFEIGEPEDACLRPDSPSERRFAVELGARTADGRMHASERGEGYMVAGTEAGEATVALSFESPELDAGELQQRYGLGAEQLQACADCGCARLGFGLQYGPDRTDAYVRLLGAPCGDDVTATEIDALRACEGSCAQP